MIKLAERISHITPSMTFAISNKAKALSAQGHDVCNFGVGEPDFTTPRHIRDAAKAALDAGKTKYAPTAGVGELRALIAEKLKRENGLDYVPEQILVTTGGKQALFNTLLAILGPGDEALIPAPYWVTYPEIVKLAGADVVAMPTSEATDFKITPEQLDAAINPRTKVLLLNSPSNPTGAVYTPAEIEALAEVLLARGVTVVSDEIYEKLIYDEGLVHKSIGSVSEAMLAQTITCNGFSKAYAATGWRLGYAAAPLNVIKAANAIQGHSTSGANTFAQYGAIKALEADQSALEEMRLVFKQRRDYLVEAVAGIDGITCTRPQGAFYVFPNIAATGLDSITFCERLLQEEYVAAVPGVAFGADLNIRLSYATDMTTLEKGVERLARFVSTLVR